ncbi:MAG: hypothetical protein CMQ15_00050 [Gammaproteobacteria bacterium]|jgi:glutaredoxin-related protein|nr:hypothetical protein [Gammaproteobacteria bacterium]|tara:strand:- start:5355 stop:5669 length:315 start_codon:yes stop_codon:yes gene_type:complete
MTWNTPGSGAWRLIVLPICFETIMKSIKFYHSIICPRCAMARRELKKLKEEFPDLEIEPIEVLTKRGKKKEDGVRQFPALVHADKSLSGFILTRAAIRSFLVDI